MNLRRIGDDYDGGHFRRATGLDARIQVQNDRFDVEISGLAKRTELTWAGFEIQDSGFGA
jgi:hypothetical protein